MHGLRNVEAHCPKRALDDLRTNVHEITEVKSLAAAEEAYARLIACWQRRCPGVARSLQEAGKELLTFFRFPRAQWKCLRTTHAIARLHEEFRRRIRAQASLPTEASVRYLFPARYASGQIRMRRIDGWQHLATMIAADQPVTLTAAA